MVNTQTNFAFGLVTRRDLSHQEWASARITEPPDQFMPEYLAIYRSFLSGKAPNQSTNLVFGEAGLLGLYVLHLVVCPEDIERGFMETLRSFVERDQSCDVGAHSHFQQDDFRHVILQELAACRHERQAYLLCDVIVICYEKFCFVCLFVCLAYCLLLCGTVPLPSSPHSF